MIYDNPQALIDSGYPEGVDVSRWNMSFDPDLSQHQIDFAFQKITEGTTWIDPKVEEIWAGVAKVAVRGAYHYIRSGYSWTAQVDHFMSVFVRHDYHVAIVDLESNNGDNILNDTLYADTRRWIDAVRKASGKRVVLYTNGSIWTLFQSAIKRLYADGQAWLNDLDLWLAWPSLTATEPITPCKIWQYRWDGTGYGTGSVKCDVNRFIGTKQQLLEWADSDGVIDPPPPGETMYYKCVKDVSIRNNTNYPNNNVIGLLKAGDVVNGEMLINVNPTIPNWVHFTKIYRGGVTVELLDGYSSGYTTYLQEDSTFVPPDLPPVGSKAFHMDANFNEDGTITGTWYPLT